LEGSTYAAPRLGYLLIWGAALILLSSAFAYTLGTRPKPIAWIANRFTPRIVDISAWYHVFEEGPADASVFVGCDLRDGSYLSGTLDWYSTEVEESADRDFVLAQPLELRPPGAKASAKVQDVERMVVSARDVARFYVAYLKDETNPTEQTAVD